jgi:uncharacterized protein YggE
LALTAAREKAEKMAAVLGCTVGKPLEIRETPVTWYSSNMSQNRIQDTREPSAEGVQSMAPGKLSIRAGVSVTFELKSR